MAVRYDIFTTREDGEVMLDELMSADWTALQVNVMPLDSSGAYTPLVSGTVSVKVSPFESGDYWIDVNNNNYYGVALRLKIIKTELPAAVSSLRVSVWRANHYGTKHDIFASHNITGYCGAEYQCVCVVV